jgi:exonuclease-1
VAPYEADAQLAYLSKIKYVDIVMTEDSDLLAYGCEQVLFKYENEGYVDEISIKKLPECKELNFTNFSHEIFLSFCILCGCDYFKLEKCGAKKAYQIVKDKKDYNEVLLYLKHQNLNVNDAIEKDFEKAFLTFKFQVVFCPLIKQNRYFTDLDDMEFPGIKKYLDDLSFLGE